MKKITKWTKCYIIQVKDDDGWRTVSKDPLTQLQAVRLIVQTQFLRNYFDANNVRIQQDLSLI
jgi:hypothetical protein